MKKLLLVLLTLLLLTACGESQGDGEKVYNIGVLQIVQHEALDNATKGFEDALREKLGDKVKFDEKNAAGEPANCALIANQFVADDVDLIFANATPSLQAAVQATDTIPVVATSVTAFKVALSISDWTGFTGINATGTSDLAPLDQQAAQLVELVPDAKKVAIFFCNSEANSVFQADEIEKHFAKLGIETQRFTFADSNDIAQVAMNACEWADAVYLPTDNTAAAYVSADQFSKPVIAGEAGICKKAGVATISITYYDIGYRAGEMAYEILVNGADPATMKVEEVTKTEKMYNKELCDKFNITIPEGYVEVE